MNKSPGFNGQLAARAQLLCRKICESTVLQVPLSGTELSHPIALF
jgi:hypothetical protein